MALVKITDELGFTSTIETENVIEEINRWLENRDETPIEEINVTFTDD